jgi:hypothetical protein
LALEDDPLLAEQCILCAQLRSREGEIGNSAKEEARASGLSELAEDLMGQSEKAGEETGMDREKRMHTIENSLSWAIETSGEIGD